MRTMTLVLTVVAALVSGQSLANSAPLHAADSRVETQLCISAASEPLHQFKQDAKQHHVSLALLANKLQCNDQSIASFARSYGNAQVAAQLGRLQRGHVDIEVISSATTPSAVTVSGALSPN